MRFLLDTDTCIHVLKTRNKPLISRLEKHEGQIATSAIVMHELYYGAQGYAEPERRLFLIDQLAARLTVLPFDRAAALEAGMIRFNLAKAGKTIGPYDGLIAATALAHGLTLITGNTREFGRIAGLKLENWVA